MMHRDTIQFVKHESRKFIKTTTQHVVDILQIEMKYLLEQQLKYQEKMMEKDNQMRDLCERVKEQNWLIAQYAIKFAASNQLFEFRLQHIDLLNNDP